MTPIKTPKKLIEVALPSAAFNFFAVRVVIFTQEPDWAVTSVNLDIDALLKRALSAEAGK
jgi:hypothetical protein